MAMFPLPFLFFFFNVVYMAPELNLPLKETRISITVIVDW